MKDIAIYGAGGLGREVACLLNLINVEQKEWNLIGFFDDNKPKNSENEFGVILGGIGELNRYKKKLHVVIAVGSPKILAKIYKKITNDNVLFPNIIAPNVIFLDKEHLTLGKGNLFCLGCTVTCNIQIGDFNQFNGYITIGHDVTIGNYNSFMPGVRISGNVNIGSYNFMGTNSVVLQKNVIGDETVIGASSVIIRNTKDGETYIGNPARKFNY